MDGIEERRKKPFNLRTHGEQTIRVVGASLVNQGSRYLNKIRTSGVALMKGSSQNV